MKIIIALLFLFVGSGSYSQNLTIVSWNIENIGKSKSDSTIVVIANTIRSADIACIMEVVAGPGGAQAIARLAEALNQTGAQWDYRISDPTISSSYKTERYAFVWKKHRVKLVGKTWLEQQYSELIDREPYYATFNFAGKEFTLAAFHAITKSKQPETEIKYFKFLPAQYPNLNLIFCGDFNCPQTHTVFNPLKKMGYAPVLTNQKTSLRQQCINDDCLASEFDNIFYDTSKVKLLNAGIWKFYESMESLQDARRVSDHVPVFMKFELIGQ